MKVEKGGQTVRRWAKRDPKAVWCICGHHSTKHTHEGYQRLYGMIIRTVRGRCTVEGCGCLRIRWITRKYRDVIVARRRAREGSPR